MRFASLGSGSEGNALLIECDAGSGGCLLVDCGFSVREVDRRLSRLGRQLHQLRGILVTHEHADHIGGAFRLAEALGIAVHLTHGTLAAARGADGYGAAVVIVPDQPFELHGLTIEPFPVPHDAREPVQFVIDDGRSRLGILTDIGHPTAHLPRALADLTALVLECNHDSHLLAGSDYPPRLKQRISGRYGHLANDDSARVLQSLDNARLRRVVAAHLSRQNNRPELAQRALAAAIGADVDDILVATQDEGLQWTAA
ncbi:MAG TPA: MBL fold metallo-hydrolase [Burkholderiaceae bacterium]|nr:MBL fold metallo-hydrolase [Burkholderiaceae bacterium]